MLSFYAAIVDAIFASFALRTRCHDAAFVYRRCLSFARVRFFCFIYALLLCRYFDVDADAVSPVDAIINDDIFTDYHLPPFAIYH